MNRTIALILPEFHSYIGFLLFLSFQPKQVDNATVTQLGGGVTESKRERKILVRSGGEKTINEHNSGRQNMATGVASKL